MTTQTPDGQLVAEYVAEGSETAFGALVKRHAGMVYATALRQVGESGLAEEVTQNTFLALARKAPRKYGDQTLAGWLHRTALLESKARIRKELRHRRREEIAATLATSDREGESTVAHLVPMLDEALMGLRDTDRQALVLRFLEDCSLREVGNALGVEEEAARKRVSRALDRVCDFFRQRGFAVPLATLTSLLVEQSTAALPVGLMATATQIAVTSTGATPSIQVAGLKIMALSKTQTAVVTLLIVAAPLTWQWRAQADVDQDHDVIQIQLVQDEARLQSLEEEISQERQSLGRVEMEHANAEIYLKDRRDQLEKREPPPVYAWNDFAPLARVPKSFLARLSLPAVREKNGTLNDRMILALQFTEIERQGAQAALDNFLERFNIDQGQRMRQVEPRERDLDSHQPEEVRVFEMTHENETFAGFRQALFDDLQEVLGVERFELFKPGLSGWIPLDDDFNGINSGMITMGADHRYVFYQPEPGSDLLAWGVKVDEHGSIFISQDLSSMDNWLPDHLRLQLQDWIDLAQPLPEVVAP